MSSKILFILHLPPPIHGAAMMGKYIQENELVNSSFDCFCINLATAGSLSDIHPVASDVCGILHLQIYITEQTASRVPA